MIKGIFFATFDVNEGPKIHHQVPASIITASSTFPSQPTNPSAPLLHFPTISSLIIPHPTLCNIGPTHFTSAHHRILGCPQHIPSSAYPRNAFVFNFCIVLAEEEEFSRYVSVVGKLNGLMRGLEERGGFLSRDGEGSEGVNEGSREGGRGKIYAMCEILLEDLNNYSETMIPIDASNTLNIKLFPTYPPPPPLFPYQVPLATVNLAQLIDDNWDLTLLKVLPYIDGVNSVKQIALKADVDERLCRKAVRHLLYYGCCVLLDIFSFGASYACTAEVGGFVRDKGGLRECGMYVSLVGYRESDSDREDEGARGEGEGDSGDERVTGSELVELYLSLRQGLSVKAWCMERPDIVNRIDVRRFITFGVIKGFLYRVHKYAYAAGAANEVASSKRVKKKRDGKDSEANLNHSTPNIKPSRIKTPDTTIEARDESEGEELTKYLDGTHCFDEICTDLMISEKELMVRLKKMGDVCVISR